MPGHTYTFGPFEYDPATRRLTRDGALVPLVPKVADTLHALLERRGQVVEKAELMKLVWPDCVVEEIGLARNISLLRKALGDDAESWIETIPKRGYRFAAAEPPAAVPHRRFRLLWAWLAGLIALAALVVWQFYWPSPFLPQAGRTASLAVIPVECLSPELEQGAFSQSFTSLLVEEISRIETVHVTSPSTVARYRMLRIPTPVMARLLGLHVVVESTAQQVGSGIRLSVRLTDVHSGKLIWAQGYDLDPAGPPAALANAIAREIGSRLKNPSPGPKPFRSSFRRLPAPYSGHD